MNEPMNEEIIFESERSLFLWPLIRANRESRKGGPSMLNERPTLASLLAGPLLTPLTTRRFVIRTTTSCGRLSDVLPVSAGPIRTCGLVGEKKHY